MWGYDNRGQNYEQIPESLEEWGRAMSVLVFVLQSVWVGEEPPKCPQLVSEDICVQVPPLRITSTEQSRNVGLGHAKTAVLDFSNVALPSVLSVVQSADSQSK